MEEGMAELRARKRERARGAIVAAAYELFAERGFDQVTVADIAERAEVGRTTFFRYFGDKQEVIFSGTDSLLADAPPVERAIGDDLAAALAVVRTLVAAYIGRITDPPDLYRRHGELVASHPELSARSLVKQRAYADATARWLIEQGAEPQIAVLAAEVGLACFTAGRAAAGSDPAVLAAQVDAAFVRLGLTT
jgi:AcrR family transcriptional regulator